MAESLEGRIALITGAARGMGRAIADVFAREGAAVGLLDVQEVELQQVVEGIRADGGKVIGQVADVRSSDQVEAAVQAVVNQLGPIDILVNSAGLGMPGRVHELAEADRHALLVALRDEDQVDRQGPGDRLDGHQRVEL